jgi:GTPase SAR1 family protein
MKAVKKDFFNSPVPGSSPVAIAAPPLPPPVPTSAPHIYKPGRALPLIAETKKLFAADGFKNLFAELLKIEKNYLHSSVKIAVVGEFSRGKSMFVNRLLCGNCLSDKEYVPTGSTPVTAFLTKILYSAAENITYVSDSGAKARFALGDESWERLTVGLDGSNPIVTEAGENSLQSGGTVIVGANCDWLKRTNIEVIDTPGVNDTDEKRLKLASDALICTDGTVITVSAVHPLGISEKVFIEQKILSAKIPNIIVVVNQLDLIPDAEKEVVLKRISGILDRKSIKMFVVQDKNELKFDTSAVCPQGINAIRAEIENWAKAISVSDTRSENAAIAVSALLTAADAVYDERIALLSESDKEKRRQLIEESTNKLNTTKETWTELENTMEIRKNECSEWLKKTIHDRIASTVERFEFETAHSNNPAQWYKNDLPFKLRSEMTGMSQLLENELNRRYNNDIAEIRNQAFRKFRADLSFEKIESAKNETKIEITELKVSDLSKERNYARIALGAASVGAFVLLSATALPIIAVSTTMGVGGSLITEKLFSKISDEQRRIINNEIEKKIPEIFENWTLEAQKRIESIYSYALKNLKQNEEIWYKEQTAAVEKIDIPDSNDKMKIAHFKKSKQALEKLHSISEMM